MSIVATIFIFYLYIMSTIDQLYEAVSQLKLKEQLPTLILATAFEIETLVKVQLQSGETATNEKINPSYASAYYSRKKESFNSAPGYGVPDLYVTGNLYKSIGVSVKDDEYDIQATVDYAYADSIIQYGDKVFALSDEHKQEYCATSLLPAIGKYIKDVTGLELSGE